MISKVMGGLIAAASLVWIGMVPAFGAPFMIVGNDEKIAWDDEGKLILSLPGRDSVVILDLAEPEMPRVVATLPLKNSVVGPPVNLASRLTAVARRNRIIIDQATAELLPDSEFETRRLPARPVRGFGIVEPVAVRRA